PDLLAHGARGVGVLRRGVGARQTALRFVPGALRDAQQPGLGRERGRVPPLPPVDLLHSLRLSPGRRGRGDIRSDAHSAAPAGPAAMSPTAAIDLRSDTVTKPSAAMRRAIAEADV